MYRERSRGATVIRNVTHRRWASWEVVDESAVQDFVRGGYGAAEILRGNCWVLGGWSVEPLDAFYSTWSDARKTFGQGTPQDGSNLDNSSRS